MGLTDEYNADVLITQNALNASSSEFAWMVRGYGPELAFDLGLWNRNPTIDDLELLQIRAKPKQYHEWERRPAVFIYLNRELVHGDLLSATVVVLERAARDAVKRQLARPNSWYETVYIIPSG